MYLAQAMREIMQVLMKKTEKDEEKIIKGEL
jgi:hypothetical protein